MTNTETSEAESEAKTKSSPESETNGGTAKPCCFFLRYGTCVPPRGTCRFGHDILDDGKTPCCFGATCRLGHAKRVQELLGATYEERVQYWTHQKQQHQQQQQQDGVVDVVVDAPAQRDANLLQSQLEPWSTATLRERLVTSFGCGTFAEWEGIARGKLMDQLLKCYAQQQQQQRKRIRVQTTPTAVRPELLQILQDELIAWKKQHGDTNTRPSIHAQSYMILRKDCLTGMEGGDDDEDDKDRGDGDADEDSVENDDQRQPNSTSSWSDCKNDTIAAAAAATTTTTTTTTTTITNSRKARQAQKKMQQYANLWRLAWQALNEVDPDYAESFSALAVTYQFRGSPHIDKQNTGPFYGLALGDFVGGGICVEADFQTVAVCDSHNRFAKVDGRFPHWVENYEGERYSLIFYSTTHDYQKPRVAYFGTIVD